MHFNTLGQVCQQVYSWEKEPLDRFAWKWYTTW